MKIIVVLSGGLDSSVLLHKLVVDGHEVRALTIDYGQRHKREIKAARKICDLLRVEHQVIDLSCLKPLLAGSSQTDDSVAVPSGNYDEPSMRQTIVANRNMMLLSVAGMWAISTKSNAIAYAAHAGDHAVYPDCREEFIDPLAKALKNADWHQVEIIRPFLHYTKADIVCIGSELDSQRAVDGKPMIMPLTYSCYGGKEQHDAICGTCRERRRAFFDAGILDPTDYDLKGLQEVPMEMIPKL